MAAEVGPDRDLPARRPDRAAASSRSRRAGVEGAARGARDGLLHGPDDDAAGPGPQPGGHRRLRRGENGGWSQASHACWIEIDQETGKITIPRYLVVEDCGKIINPSVVDGQVIGGVVMGLGGMLLEHSAYGADGQYLAGTFMDYLMPSAPEVPDMEIVHMEFETPTMVGSRGVGEGGTVLAPAVLLNAVDDAFAQVGGKRITATPLTPTTVLEALGVLES